MQVRCLNKLHCTMTFKSSLFDPSIGFHGHNKPRGSQPAVGNVTVSVTALSSRPHVSLIFDPLNSCVESIISTLQPMLKSPGEQITASRETIKSTLESAETIMECVQHQKFIMDDVLTLSKIGSGLLVVSPIEIQPLDELKRGLRLFEGELRQADIPLQLVVDPSYKDLNIDYLLLDPTRLLQILINLITNAIKCKLFNARLPSQPRSLTKFNVLSHER